MADAPRFTRTSEPRSNGHAATFSQRSYTLGNSGINSDRKQEHLKASKHGATGTGFVETGSGGESSGSSGHSNGGSGGHASGTENHKTAPKPEKAKEKAGQPEPQPATPEPQTSSTRDRAMGEALRHQEVQRAEEAPYADLGHKAADWHSQRYGQPSASRSEVQGVANSQRFDPLAGMTGPAESSGSVPGRAPIGSLNTQNAVNPNYVSVNLPSPATQGNRNGQPSGLPSRDPGTSGFGPRTQEPAYGLVWERPDSVSVIPAPGSNLQQGQFGNVHVNVPTNAEAQQWDM